MHDATECGVLGGLVEIAEASQVGMHIEKERIPVSEEIRGVCDLFGIDPYISISEGTLLLTCRPHKAEEVIRRLDEGGITAVIIGEVLPSGRGCEIQDGDKVEPLVHPRVDPFWQAFGKAASGG